MRSRSRSSPGPASPGLPGSESLLVATAREAVFVSVEETRMAGTGRTRVMDADDLRRALTRIAHEIVEKNRGAADLALVGIRTKGVPLAHRLSELIYQFENVRVPVGSL